MNTEEKEVTWEDIEDTFGMSREECVMLMHAPQEVQDLWFQMRVAIERGELEAERKDGRILIKPADGIRFAMRCGVRPPPALMRAMIEQGAFDND